MWRFYPDYDLLVHKRGSKREIGYIDNFICDCYITFNRLYLTHCIETFL